MKRSLSSILHARHPDNVVLLIDTYDTEAGAAKVASLARKLACAGNQIKGVRLDSGDLAAHARQVRDILDKAGLESTTIFASGNLDEYRLNALYRAGAPIDGFGVGTALDVSSDAPSLDLCVQAAGICRKGTAQTLGREGHLAGKKTGLSQI